MHQPINATKLAFAQKRGASFSHLLIVPLAFPDGYFENAEVHAQLRTPDGRSLVAQLEATWHDPVVTRHLFLRKNDTSDWPLAVCLFDVKFAFPDGRVLPTRTFAIDIVLGVTNAPYQ